MPAQDADADAALQGGSRWTIAIVALLGLGLGLAVFAFRGDTFEAQARVAVANPAGALADQIEIVTGEQVLGAATAALGFEPDISTGAATTAGQLTITATNDNPDDAAAAANMVAATYVQVQAGTAASITELAETPNTPTGLGPLVFAGIGALLGGLVGSILAAVRTRRRREQFLRSLHVSPGSTPSRIAKPPSAQPVPDAPHIPATPSPPTVRDVPDVQNAPAARLVPTVTETPNMPAPVSEPPPIPEASERQPKSFFDAAVEDRSPDLNWLTPAESGEAPPSLEQLDRLAMKAQFDAARYELVLAQDEQMAKLAADHERETASLRVEVGSLNKQVRMQSVRLKNRTGNDQSRVGDLEIQVDALEVELAALRQTLESERISHTKRITDERGTADRALDNARRQYREELSKHVHGHRQTLAEHRSDLDKELAADRAKQAQALEQQHGGYEAELETERSRADAKLAAAQERHDREIAILKTANLQELDRQATQHKQTISSLRGAGEGAQGQLRELEKENRKLRVELTSHQKQASHNDTENVASQQRYRDEVALLKNELDGERQRNAALRADVLRRSAEAHQAIDRAVEERTAQLAELEASVSRQRQYADSRVREVSAAAEEQARQAATREASLTATLSRLKRELEDLKKVHGQPSD